MMRSIFPLLLCSILVSVTAGWADQPAPAPTPAHAAGHDHGAQLPPARAGETRFPDIDEGVVALPARRATQLATASTLGAFHDFAFVDRLPESGITFRHRGVDDAGRTYKAVHYDHGNGLAVADVDGDGRLDLYFVTQLGDNELWRNLGGGRFENATAAAGVAMRDQISVAASFADVDNDGDADLFVTTVRKGNHLFLNDGKGRFEDATAASGLGYVGHSSGAVFFDYDRDGRLDLFLTNVGRYTTDAKGRGGYYIGVDDAFQGHLYPERAERSILYRNLGDAKFQDVSEQVGLIDTSWSGDASPADFDEDGWPDLYVLNMQGDDHYWVNEGGKRFVEKGAQYFPKTPWGAMGIKVFDYDNDGRADLYVTDMHSDMSEQVGVGEEKLKSDMQWSEQVLQGGANNLWGNALYHNLGGGRLEEVSDAMGVENYWPWGLSAGDLNADGFQDLFVTASMNFPFRYGINSLLLNDGGKTFRDAEFLLGVEPRRDGRTHTLLVEMDCDGEDKGARPCLGRTGKLGVYSTLGSRSSAMLDLDGDGDLDLVTADFNSEPQVLISNLAERRPGLAWITVALRGTRSNRDGLGAKVVVKAGGHTFTQWHDGKSGYLSQSAMPLYFGLAGAKKVDAVTVTWPSGVTQTVTNPPVNKPLVVTEKAGR